MSLTSPQAVALPRPRLAAVTRLRVAPWWRPALLAAVPAWLAARLAVGAGFVLARVVVDQLAVDRPPSLVDGLGGWDAHHYRTIADHGYGAVSEGYRFFPLFPLLLRLFRPLALGNTSVVAIVVANVAALALGVALYRLVLLETGSERTATLATWLVVASAASTPLVMGYAESLGLLASVGALLAARQGQWWRAAGFGLVVGATWSLGLLLAVPLAIIARRGRPLLVALAPVAATGAYLGWVQVTTGRAWHLVFGVQTEVYERTLRDPVTRTVEAGADLLAGHAASGVYLPWIALAVPLAVLAFRRLPLAYAALSTSIVLVALCADNIDSLERYLLRAFPLAIVGAACIKTERSAWLVTSASVAGLVVYSTAIFIGAKVP